MTHTYLIALGSNRRNVADGSPRKVLAGAVEVLEDLGLLLHALSPTIETPPLGPSSRRYANAAAVLETRRDPPTLLGVFKAMEHQFGRKSRGQRWGERVLDLDIILWDGGIWAEPTLQIPHPHFRTRSFVLGPASTITPDWRDPVTGLSVKQLHTRLTRPRPLPSAARGGWALSSVGRATDF